MLNTELVSYLANLSKIELVDVEREKLVAEMSAIVELMDAMNEITMEENINAGSEEVELEHLREDKVVLSCDREIVLANAPHKKDGFFVVPKIMD